MHGFSSFVRIVVTIKMFTANAILLFTYFVGYLRSDHIIFNEFLVDYYHPHVEYTHIFVKSDLFDYTTIVSYLTLQVSNAYNIVAMAFVQGTRSTLRRAFFPKHSEQFLPIIIYSEFEAIDVRNLF